MTITPRTLWLLLSILLVIVLNLGATGSHVYNPGNRVYWIDPITTTLPYIGLLVFTLRSISQNEKNKQSTLLPIAGYIGAWLSMVIFTLWLIFLEPGPSNSSTMGIAILFTPLFFLAAALPGYIVGLIIFRLLHYFRII